MPVIGAMLRGVCPRGPVVVRPAQSGHLAPVAGDDWLTVGDAAAGFDPLSSQGIAKALRSGIFASYAIGDLLTTRRLHWPPPATGASSAPRSRATSRRAPSTTAPRAMGG
jgi:flavin-dependent dehydrogenase